MSTRGAVCLEVSSEHYAAYYNHYDSYPTWLGVRLAKLLKTGKTADKIIEALKLEDYQRVFAGTFGNDVAKQVYPGLQADLEWIYVVDFSQPSIQIFRTSNPNTVHGPDFVFSVWFCRAKKLPDDIEGTMRQVELVAEAVLSGLAACHRR